jgi:NAD(P)H-hydrate repair Nnr-like enzyme with NAD(P)H-hydrate epimerase domain
VLADRRHFHESESNIASRQNGLQYQAMKMTKNLGMVLLAVYLIVDGLLGFGLRLGPAIFLLYIVAIVAGVLILLGK